MIGWKGDVVDKGNICRHYAYNPKYYCDGEKLACYKEMDNDCCTERSICPRTWLDYTLYIGGPIVITVILLIIVLIVWKMKKKGKKGMPRGNETFESGTATGTPTRDTYFDPPK